MPRQIVLLQEYEIIEHGFAVIKYIPKSPATFKQKMLKGDARLWTAHYQASANVCCKAWNAMQRKNLPDVEPKHLFWALCHLKTYSTEDIAS